MGTTLEIKAYSLAPRLPSALLLLVQKSLLFILEATWEGGGLGTRLIKTQNIHVHFLLTYSLEAFADRDTWV